MSFENSKHFYNDMKGGKLHLAIVDCTNNSSQFFLANIGMRFNKVILLNYNAKKLDHGILSSKIKKALREKYKLSDMPKYL